MKKLAIILLLISSITHAQENFIWGLKEGMSFSQISGNPYKGFRKLGFTGGAFIQFRLSDYLNIATEAVYTEFGSLKRVRYDKGHIDRYFLQLNYVQFPLLFQFHIEKFGLELGPGYGLLLNTKEIDVIDGIPYTGTNSFKKEDINYNIGLTYGFDSRFGLNLRYTNSINPIRTLGSTSQKNNVLTLCLTFEFGEDGPFWK